MIPDEDKLLELSSAIVREIFRYIGEPITSNDKIILTIMDREQEATVLNALGNVVGAIIGASPNPQQSLDWFCKNLIENAPHWIDQQRELIERMKQ